MAISGTMETPMPAPTMLSKLLNWPLSKTIWGWRRARSQAATAVSRKQWPSRSSRNGSERRAFRTRERSKTRREEVGSYRGNDANGDEAADGVLALDDVAFGGFQLAENGAGARQKCFADVGKPYRAAQAVEETRAELAFEFHDLLGEGWLRDVRLLGGAAKAAGFGDGAKVAKLMQLHRLCLSILSELYIGCIGRAPLTLQLRSQAARFARLQPSN